MDCILLSLVLFAVFGATAFWLLILPHIQRELEGPQPVVLQTSMSGFMCRISTGAAVDDDTLLLCDAHELILRIPAILGRKEHRIPLGALVHVTVRGKGMDQVLAVQTTDDEIEVPAGGHVRSSLDELIERILKVAGSAEALQAPDELLDILDR